MKILKYPVKAADVFGIEMPAGAKILSVQVQGGQPKLWVMADERLHKEIRQFRLIPTGLEFEPARNWQFVGTFQIEEGMRLVFHLFEISNVL